MSERREFWIFEANDNYEDSGSVATDIKEYRKEIQNQAIHVREVLPGDDDKLVIAIEALESLKSHVCLGLVITPESAKFSYVGNIAREALKKLKE